MYKAPVPSETGQIRYERVTLVEIFINKVIPDI